MSDIVDACGYLCPQPVMMLVSKIKTMRKGQFEIHLDNQMARENVCRTVAGLGWIVEENIEITTGFKLVVASKT